MFLSTHTMMRSLGSWMSEPALGQITQPSCLFWQLKVFFFFMLLDARNIQLRVMMKYKSILNFVFCMGGILWTWPEDWKSSMKEAVNSNITFVAQANCIRNSFDSSLPIESGFDSLQISDFRKGWKDIIQRISNQHHYRTTQRYSHYWLSNPEIEVPRFSSA